MIDFDNLNLNFIDFGYFDIYEQFKGLGALLTVFGLSFVFFQNLQMYSTIFKRNNAEKIKRLS